MPIRLADESDVPFLWRMLTFAAQMDGSEEAIASAKADPTLKSYLVDFPRESDLGMVAENADGLRIAGAWLRTGEPGPGKVWTRESPELAIATIPEARGTGTGGLLLGALIERARGRFDAITLSVREGNPAARLYPRFGFVVVSQMTNRVGTASLSMRLDLNGGRP